MSNFSISVVVTCFNNSSYILQCLKSVVSQVNVDLQVIVVDDCSTDNSLSILQHFSSYHDNIEIVQNKVNMGVAYSRNQGLSLASHQFISFLDGDDFYLHSYKLFYESKTLNTSFVDDHRPCIAFSPHYYSDQFSKPIHGIFIFPPLFYNRIFFLLRFIHIPRDFLSPTSLVRSLNGFDESLNLYEDWDFKIRLLRHCNFKLASPLYGSCYRRHYDGLSKQSKSILFAALSSYFKKNTSSLEYILLYPFHYISFYLFSPASSVIFKIYGSLLNNHSSSFV